MIVREIFTKSILSKSQIQDYAINPYVGCSHSCRYCYAAFMRRFTGHKERWGEFVDVKVNAPDRIYRDNHMEWAKEALFFIQKAEQLKKGFIRQNIPVQVVF